MAEVGWEYFILKFEAVFDLNFLSIITPTNDFWVLLSLGKPSYYLKDGVEFDDEIRHPFEDR